MGRKYKAEKKVEAIGKSTKFSVKKKIYEIYIIIFLNIFFANLEGIICKSKKNLE